MIYGIKISFILIKSAAVGLSTVIGFALQQRNQTSVGSLHFTGIKQMVDHISSGRELEILT